MDGGGTAMTADAHADPFARPEQALPEFESGAPEAALWQLMHDLLRFGDPTAPELEDVAAACRGRVVAAYLFGEISPLFAGSLAELDPPVPATLAADLETATRLAAADAKPGEAVLFSPASASPPGQKYYQRGDRFKAAVAALGPNELDDVGGYLPDPLAERGHAH